MIQELQDRNQIIIDAVMAKAQKVCPESLALIGINGSFCTGDIHEKSDLDLLILINDDQGRQLSDILIQEDLYVGHDIYCTTWESLEDMAEWKSPHIAKLMDSKIVYYAKEEDLERLKSLQEKVLRTQPGIETIQNEFQEAKKFYAQMMMAESLSEVRNQAGNTLYFLTNALMLLNGRYYRKGVRRIYEELEALPVRPEDLSIKLQEIVTAAEPAEIQRVMTQLMQDTARLLPKEKRVPEENISGAYEEMVSNWRNKMYLAVKENNPYLAFSSMNALAAMFEEDLGRTQYDVMAGYDPEDLRKTAEFFDGVINEFRKEYDAKSIHTKIYPTVKEWADQYTGGKL